MTTSSQTIISAQGTEEVCALNKRGWEIEVIYVMNVIATAPVTNFVNVNRQILSTKKIKNKKFQPHVHTRMRSHDNGSDEAIFTLMDDYLDNEITYFAIFSH